MGNNINSISFMHLVSNSYMKTRSLQKTADELGISYAKVRKILITLGEYETEFSRDVLRRYNSGKSIFEIASEINVSTNRVSAFLPYEKALYLGPEQSLDSKKSRLYRKRMEVSFEKFVTNLEWHRKAKEREGNLKNELSESGEMIMNGSIEKQDKDISVVYLRLELVDDDLNDAQKQVLIQHGGSVTGYTIRRDILIPSDMPLHNLHYAIQKLFGFQNSHLRCFRLPDAIYNQLTGETVKGWSDLVGILFQPPSESEEDIFWDDDYNGGSIKSWLKKKYTGPYSYGGKMEYLEVARKDIEALFNQLQMMEVRESFSDFYERKKNDPNAEVKTLRQAPLIELTLNEMNDSVMLEGGTENLMERLEVTKVLATKDEQLGTVGIFPAAHELLYNYDFGDNWIVRITRPVDCMTLINRGYLSAEDIKEAERAVLTFHKPVCIYKEGLNVLDDVGGLHGFTNFLKSVYESDNKEEKAESLEWASSLGWTTRKISNKMLL